MAISAVRQTILMYVPTAHKIEDPELIIALMRQNPFATLISVIDGAPVATHIPVLVESADPVVLCGHIARQNRHWKVWDSDMESLVIFAGPHGYVSPSWYRSRPNVPTWNYVSIHAYGKVEIEEDLAQVQAHLERMVENFDPDLSKAQPESLTTEYLQRLMPGVVMFRMTVDRIEAKAKLNQNKAEADRLAVRERYLDSEIPDEQRMAELMPAAE